MAPGKSIGAGRRLSGLSSAGPDTTGEDYAYYNFSSAGPFDNITCVPRGSFTAIELSDANLVRSNLGGQGGRCYSRAGTTTLWSDYCEEECGALDVAGNVIPGGICNSLPEVYMRDIGWAPGGTCVDLRITNESEYRSWRTGHNGIKRADPNDMHAGFFVVVNLLGPRRTTDRPYNKYWNEHLTMTQLRYEFVNGGRRIAEDTAGVGGTNVCDYTAADYGTPLVLGRTFLTFCAPSPTPSACANTLMPPCLARVTFHETRPYPL